MKKSNCNRTKTMIVLLVIFFIASPGYSEKPDWINLPESIKSNPGVFSDESFIYATARSCIVNSDRPDKSYEIAKKRSLSRALKMLKWFGGCENGFENQFNFEIDTMSQFFSETTEVINISELQILKQWEKGNCSYSTIAIPKKESSKLSCQVDNLNELTKKYLSKRKYTQSGLSICLRITDRYSVERRKAEIAYNKLLIASERDDLVACLPGVEKKSERNAIIQQLISQNKYFRAGQILQHEPKSLNASKVSKVSNKTNTGHVSEVLNAQSLSPLHSMPYLVLAEELKDKHPVIALYGVDKAMRDGTQFKQALTQKAAYLKSINDKEFQMFDHLLNQLKDIPDEARAYLWSDVWPESWNPAVRILGDHQVANLVAVSLGQAVRGEFQPAPEGLNDVLSILQSSDSKESFLQAIDLLFKICETEPGSPDVYNLIGNCFRHLGMYEMALPFFWQALNLKPGFDQPLANLGMCCEKLNLMESAAYYYNHDAVVNSKNPWVIKMYNQFSIKEI